MIVVASAHSPNALSKVLFDYIPVGIDGSEGVKALAVAPVLLIADGMLPSSTPNWRLSCLLLTPFGAVLVDIVMWVGECYMFV